MEVNDYSWLLKTKVGDLYLSVCGEWTEEQAVLKLMTVMAMTGIVFTAMIPRKRIPGGPDNTGTIMQDEKSNTGLGYQFFAGKKFWEAAGRSGEYEAEMVRLKKEMEKGSD
jgi:hypothetical protein